MQTQVDLKKVKEVGTVTFNLYLDDEDLVSAKLETIDDLQVDFGLDYPTAKKIVDEIEEDSLR